MDHSAARRLNSQTIFSAIQGERRKRQILSAKINFEAVLTVVNDLLFAKRGKYLSEPEIIVLRGAWDDDDYEKMAENSPYSLNYLQRRIAPPLWDLLSETVGNGERVSKKKLRCCLEQITKKYHIKSVPIQEEIPPANDSAKDLEAQLPDISFFYGRLDELTQLKEAVVKKQCVSIVGVAGIGKSTLAAKLIKEISEESPFKFDYLVWKSVAHAPSIQDLVADLIDLTGNLESGIKLPKSTPAMINLFIKQMQSHRCLVVLDECEEFFQTDNLEHRLEYNLFFRRLIEEEHQSCFVLTSRVWPHEFDVFIEADRPIQYLRIEGLDTEAAKEFLCKQGLVGQEKHCQELIEIYRGNPSEMKAVANKINYFFAGSTETFLKNKTTFISSRFREMLDEMFGQVLSEFQQQIMIYLAEEALSSFNVGLNELMSGLKQKYELTVSTSDLITALESLEKQSLIETNKDPITKKINFTLQPVIKKYINKNQMRLLSIFNVSFDLAIAS